MRGIKPFLIPLVGSIYCLGIYHNAEPLYPGESMISFNSLRGRIKGWYDGGSYTEDFYGSDILMIRGSINENRDWGVRPFGIGMIYDVKDRIKKSEGFSLAINYGGGVGCVPPLVMGGEVEGGVILTKKIRDFNKLLFLKWIQIAFHCNGNTRFLAWGTICTGFDYELSKNIIINLRVGGVLQKVGISLFPFLEGTELGCFIGTGLSVKWMGKRSLQK